MFDIADMDCEIDTSHQARGYIYLAEADSLTCCGHVSYYSPRRIRNLKIPQSLQENIHIDL
jgi:hypothetical protein